MAKAESANKPRIRVLSELVLEEPIKTRAGTTNAFMDVPGQPKFYEALTADYDAQIVCIKIKGQGTTCIPFSKVKRFKVGMGQASE